MRERVAELTVNTNVFKEQVDFSKDTRIQSELKHVLFYELVPLHYADTLEIMVLDNIKGQIIIGKKTHEVLEHDVVIVPPYYVPFHHSSKKHWRDVQSKNMFLTI